MKYKVIAHQKQIKIEAFKNSNKTILIMTTDIAVGLNCQFISHVVFNDLPWTYADLSQAEDRCHRIGQSNVVNVNYVSSDTIFDSYILKLIEFKRREGDLIATGESKIKEIENTLINDFYKEIKKKYKLNDKDKKENETQEERKAA